MTPICRYCYAQQTVKTMRAKAEAESLPCLSQPYLLIADTFQAMADGEKHCRCGEPPPAKRPKTKPKLPEDDLL